MDEHNRNCLSPSASLAMFLMKVEETQSYNVGPRLRIPTILYTNSMLIGWTVEGIESAAVLVPHKLT
jgi:hypothetical protein